jgi:uncharacterized protein involved in response to NO
MRFHPFLRAGFRPFFLGDALWAVLVTALWVAAISGTITLPTRFDPLAPLHITFVIKLRRVGHR